MATDNQKTNDPQDNKNKLIDEYKAIRPKYESLTTEVSKLLEFFLEKEGISIQQVEGRAKSVESLEEKVCRPGKNYEYDLTNLPDLSGVRIIAHYLDDITTITSIIRTNFIVIEEESDDKADSLDDDRFGYRSVHFVVLQKNDRLSLPEWSEYKELKVEIQVRTVLQHAWAAVSHALSYKHEGDVAKPLRRKLNRLAGLFELADEQFCELRIDRDKVSQRTQEKISNKHYDIEITPDSLAKYIDNTGAGTIFLTFAQGIGWSIVPFCHDNRHNDFVDLSGICDLVGMKRLNEFDDFIKEMQKDRKGIGCLSELSDACPGIWSVSPLFIIQLILLVSRGKNVSLEEMVERVDWGHSIAETALEVAHNR